MENSKETNSNKIKRIVFIAIIVLVVGAAINNYNKYGAVFADAPTDSKLKSYCEEFIEEYYPQNSGIKFGSVSETEDTRKVVVFIKTENILSVNEEVHFEFLKSGKLNNIYQMSMASPFFEVIKKRVLVIESFNSKYFNE